MIIFRKVAIGQVVDCTTGCILDYPCFKKKAVSCNLLRVRSKSFIFEAANGLLKNLENISNSLITLGKGTTDGINNKFD